MTDYVSLVRGLILPLVVYPNDVVILKEEDEDSTININVSVNDLDFGRVIGKGGKIANAMRTIVYAAASKENQKVKVNIGQKSEE